MLQHAPSNESRPLGYLAGSNCSLTSAIGVTLCASRLLWIPKEAVMVLMLWTTKPPARVAARPTRVTHMIFEAFPKHRLPLLIAHHGELLAASINTSSVSRYLSNAARL